MKKITVRDFRNKFSQYLKEMANGEEFEVSGIKICGRAEPIELPHYKTGDYVYCIGSEYINHVSAPFFGKVGVVLSVIKQVRENFKYEFIYDVRFASGEQASLPESSLGKTSIDFYIEDMVRYKVKYAMEYFREEYLKKDSEKKDGWRWF